jgi:zinc protease
VVKLCVLLSAALFSFTALFSSPALAVDVHAFNLAKGEQVWYVSDHTLPMIAMSAAIPAGSAYDSKPGLAAFAAALLDQGAGKLNANAFQTALADRAIRLKVSCNRDWLIVSLVTLTDNAKDAFQLLGLALSQPRFDADAIARVREQILSRLTEDESKPDRVVEDAFYGAFFHDHPYAHPTNGDRTSVLTINAGDLKRFASTHWLGGGLKIAVSGDFDQPTLAALLKTAFGRLPLKNPPALAPAAHDRNPGFHVVPTSGRQAVAVFGLPDVLGRVLQVPLLLPVAGAGHVGLGLLAPAHGVIEARQNSARVSLRR